MGLAPTVSGRFKEVAIHQKQEKLVKSEEKDPKKINTVWGCLEFQCLERFRNRNSISSSE